MSSGVGEVTKCVDCQDCTTCVRLQEIHGSCEAILPEYCNCDMFRVRNKKNEQGSLPIAGFVRVKITRPSGVIVYRQFEKN